ncbi:hypothetical protein HYH02_007764 [Chlamydomonas schloesseri]|uniref:Uncharacterized protein n=1 Tax=Chlamydomonas schloesseri TaxID=2026947 RepID=A0A835WHP7_9CHLO|nr:hypothetical protein HYH02_007764 [Chlamydomonas schloesseri]|eukprot:KAG2447439.1 hypothetical protein HYH02_007764 [Chlamydomonas schloesseri]
MVSRKEAAAAFTAAAKALGVRGKDLGVLSFALSKLSVEELEVFPIDGDHEAIVEFMRSVNGAVAGPSAGGAVTTAATTDAARRDQDKGKKLLAEWVHWIMGGKEKTL